MRMREILFRGKRYMDDAWVDGSLFIDEKKEKHEILVGYVNYRVGWEVNPETVGQFTGLTDKNGKKIFEGDIVEYNDGFNYFKGEVVFENGAFGIGCDEVIGISSGCSDNFANLWQLFWDQEVTDEPELYYCKVIGNIHDNPELLEGGAADV